MKSIVGDSLSSGGYGQFCNKGKAVEKVILSIYQGCCPYEAFPGMFAVPPTRVPFRIILFPCNCTFVSS